MSNGPVGMALYKKYILLILWRENVDEVGRGVLSNEKVRRVQEKQRVDAFVQQCHSNVATQ